MPLEITDDPERLAILHFEQEELAEQVGRATQMLSDPLRRSLVLYYRHDMSIAEIAAELNITPAAARKRLSRAKDRVKRELTKRGLRHE